MQDPKHVFRSNNTYTATSLFAWMTIGTSEVDVKVYEAAQSEIRGRYQHPKDCARPVDDSVNVGLSNPISGPAFAAGNRAVCWTGASHLRPERKASSMSPTLIKCSLGQTDPIPRER